ncbi:MAG: hypothetical protein H6708_20665 [Kofleriaceae bacterium]|nr:hypothetical protein [Kofleriaceae bacterium]
MTVTTISADGRVGVTAARGGEVALWDLASGVCIARGGDVHEKWVHEAVVLRDGRIATVGNELAVWRVVGRRLVGEAIGDRGGYQMLGLIVDPADPTAVITTCVDGSLMRWRLDDRSGEVLTRVSGRLSLLAAGRDGTIVARVGAKLNETGLIAWRNQECAWSLAPAPLGAHACMAIAGDRVIVPLPAATAFDLSTGRQVTMCKSIAMTMAGHREASWVVMGTDLGRLYAWDLVGDPVVIDAHRGEVYGLAIAPEARLVMSVGRDGSARLWTPRLDSVARFEPGCGRESGVEPWLDDPWALGSCAGSPDGTRWLVGGFGGQVHVLGWDGERLVALG